MSGAKKNDGEKPRVHLVPNELVFGAARAFGFGAKKYARYNWLKGMEWTRLRDAVERHLRAWTDGEETDPESGLSHLDHAAASLAMLMGHVGRGLGKDDRHCTDADPEQPEPGPTPETEAEARAKLQAEGKCRLCGVQRPSYYVLWCAACEVTDEATRDMHTHNL